MNTIQFKKEGQLKEDLDALLHSHFNPTVIKQAYGGVRYQETVTIPKTGTRETYVKAAVLLCAFACCYFGILLSGSPPFVILVILAILLGLCSSGIGFNVMHDAGHGVFSSNMRVNAIFSYTGNLVGILVGIWKTKHNAIHHYFTNIAGVDDDIEVYPVIRLDRARGLLSVHKYQHLYAWIAYLFYMWYWIYVLDVMRAIHGKIGDTPIPRSKRKPFEVIATKVFHVAAFPVLFSLVLGWKGFFLYVIMMSTMGLVLALVFQCAHVVEGVEIVPKADMEGKKHDKYAHQIETTANFAPNSKLLGWFIGGLNFQIEHHLFPQVCHVHYSALSKGVQLICKKHNLRYVSFGTFREAIVSHGACLKLMGAS